MLKATMLDAVRSAKTALQDLAQDATLYRRTTPTYVPGQPVSYEDTAGVAVKLVVVQFDRHEIDGSRVQYGDRKGVLISDEDVSTTKVGDKVVLGSSSYVIVNPELFSIGSEVAVVQFHMRPQ